MENEKEQLSTPSPNNGGQSKISDVTESAAPNAGTTAGSPSAVVSEFKSTDKLKQEMAELYDRLLRKQAELDNFRKRAQREKEELRQRAAEDLIRSLLPVLDGFERALKQRDPAVPESFYDGVELIHRQLRDVLGRAGLEAIETDGALFDPHYHQAVETIEDSGRRDQEIVEELQRGYKLKQRLLRPAIVKVAVQHKSVG